MTSYEQLDPQSFAIIRQTDPNALNRIVRIDSKPYIISKISDALWEAAEKSNQKFFQKLDSDSKLK